jgi:hypothetical protein
MTLKLSLMDLVKRNFFINLGSILIIVQIIFLSPRFEVITYIGFLIVVADAALRLASRDAEQKKKVYKGLYYALVIALVLGLYVYMKFFYNQ